MVSTLLYMNLDEQQMAAPTRQPESAIEAQRAALEAQKQAEAAQRTALDMQAAETGAEMPKTDIDNLRAIAAQVKAADEKIIEHARPNDRS